MTSNSCDQAIKCNPDDETFYSNRSASYLGMGKVNEALKDAEQCILYNGAWEKGWGRKGAALMQKGDLKGAIEAYSKADELLPDNKATLDQLAKCRKKLADKQSKSAAPAPAAGGGGGGGGGGGASAAMQAERAGWLQKKEGKIRKKWVRYYCELKGCKLRILDSEPGGVSPRPVANIVGHPVVLVGCLIGPGVCFGTRCWNTETRTPRPACASPDSGVWLLSAVFRRLWIRCRRTRSAWTEGRSPRWRRTGATRPSS